MAPEYATRGYLTDKADVYSFGIVALEIVSGRSNTSNKGRDDCFYLLDWALVVKKNGQLSWTLLIRDSKETSTSMKR
ncbi:unnamed protein product [Rhodiola kirilowii]